MKLYLLVAIGGALGASGRFGAMRAVGRWLGAETVLATPLVNIVGSFVLGVLVAAIAHLGGTTPELRTFLFVGVLGGFTTFSTYSLETVVLMERGAYGAAGAYALGSALLSIAGLMLGLRLVRWVL